MKHSVTFPFLLILIASNSASAKPQTTNLKIDLSGEHERVQVVRQLSLSGVTSISLTLCNALPNAAYDVFIRIDAVEIPMISLGVVGTSTSGSTTLGFIEQLAPAVEPGPPDPVPAQLVEDPRINDICATDTTNSATVIHLPDVAVIHPGQKLQFVVRRRADSRWSEATWTRSYTSGEKGKWRVSLGFGFPVLLDREREYFTRREDDATYTIMESSSDEKIRLIPAAFFHWVPADDELAAWSFSLTGGLGYDFRNAVVFTGISLTFQQNITFAAGAVAHQLSRLNRRYFVGEVLREPLDAEQLLQQRYAVNPFVSVSFRLSENLFGK